MVKLAGIGGFILLVLNLWAILSIIGSRASTSGKVLWSLVILIMPLLGFIIWLLAGPRAARSRG
ncbi:MAG: PLDc N-terminal domain-containing protein [Pseudomonadota bacterium]